MSNTSSKVCESCKCNPEKVNALVGFQSRKWIDSNQTFCSACFIDAVGSNADFKVYRGVDGSWTKRDSQTYVQGVLSGAIKYWVYDKEYNILCIVELGGHFGAVMYLLREYYGLTRVRKEELHYWQMIISEHMIFHNASAQVGPEHYASKLPRKRI